MKSRETCPKCQCRRLYVIERVAQASHDSINGVFLMSVTTLEVPASVVGLDIDNRYRAEIGHFEAWVCAKCGYTEWYAKEVSSLEHAAARRVPGVRLVDHDQGPYR